MKHFSTWIFIAAAFIATQTASAGEFVAENCTNDASQPVLYSSDFHWGYDMGQMIARFAEVYASPKRLPKHAYLDPVSGNFKLPYDEARGGDVNLPLSFVASVRRHLEEAIRLEYVDAIFFPDMGIRIF